VDVEISVTYRKEKLPRVSYANFKVHLVLLFVLFFCLKKAKAKPKGAALTKAAFLLYNSESTQGGALAGCGIDLLVLVQNSAIF
jgi:hypothetical protein